MFAISAAVGSFKLIAEILRFAVTIGKRNMSGNGIPKLGIRLITRSCFILLQI